VVAVLVLLFAFQLVNRSFASVTVLMVLVVKTDSSGSVQDSMVIEYRGEGLRPALQDVKEQEYQNKGVDVYLFALTETVVVDATEAGSIARFTNACCEPCLYSKIIESDGKPYLMFFAKTDIKAGQEITYDYRFRAQGQELTPCLCGAPGCRGMLEILL
jgi:[histone H3]-lysine4 N-trimethyltransferase SETD1